VVAAHDREKAARFGESPLFDLFDPGTVDANRHLMLGFTGRRTGVTTNALSIVNDKSIFHILNLFYSLTSTYDVCQRKVSLASIKQLAN
jgi:hypothetical protein